MTSNETATLAAITVLVALLLITLTFAGAAYRRILRLEHKLKQDCLGLTRNSPHVSVVFYEDGFYSPMSVFFQHPDPLTDPIDAVNLAVKRAIENGRLPKEAMDRRYTFVSFTRFERESALDAGY